ncbi:hypothetical protein C8J56DRAFT_1043496 [Mycena floridula]|nr:hypothetical protein C8J56DRAFT_1043496 [Mycena floridula]
MLWNLEISARRASQSQWICTTLPGILLTIFAQGHVAVTALHLSRLAISALQSPSTCPRSWVEMFCTADETWKGPLGFVETAIAMWKAPRPSATFFLFTLISILALATPIVVSRTYPISIKDIDVPVSFTPVVVSPTRLRSVQWRNQVRLGDAGWSTGKSVTELYRTSTYYTDMHDLFFSGDTLGLDVTVPGLRHIGSCSVLEDDLATKTNTNSNDSYTEFIGLCAQKGFVLTSDNFTVIQDSDPVILHQNCVQPSIFGVQDWLKSRDDQGENGNGDPLATGTSLAWFSSKNITIVEGRVGISTTAQGIVECISTMGFGKAFLSHGTFKAFTYEDLSARELLVHPLGAAMAQLSDNPFLDDAGDWRGRLGLGTFFDTTLEGFAIHLSLGVEHMAIAIALLASAPDETYNGIRHVAGTSRTRNFRLFVASIALLGTWVVLLLYATLRMYRRTFGPSLNSYVVGRLVADRRELVQGRGCGGLSRNEKLKTEFLHVGDQDYLYDVGHVTSGGDGQLQVDRRYS